MVQKMPQLDPPKKCYIMKNQDAFPGNIIMLPWLLRPLFCDYLGYKQTAEQ